jgi:hypothetical protein
MILVLTCALCATEPALLAGTARLEHVALLDERLSLLQLDAPSPTATPLAPLALARDESSGHGDSHSGSHMGPMWILMGAMMVVMMVGMAVYFMRNATEAQALSPPASRSPAQVALPVSSARGGGG